MKLIINGTPQEVKKSQSVQEVLGTLGYENHAHIAVALNRICVPRQNWSSTNIKENDEIEIVTPMQGG